VTERGDDLLDETTLRRALRLEADERAPLFDAATIAAAARQRPRLAIVSALVALALGVLGAVTVWSAVVIFLPTVVANVFDAGLAIFALLAVPATGTLELAQQPAVPLSLLVALAIASAHELRERRQTVASAR
jgi:hypothetical protein